MDFLENIADQFEKDLPFVIYRKPRERTVKALFQSDDRLHHLTTYAETGFVFAPFDSKHPTVLLPPDKFLEFSDVAPQAHDSISDAFVLPPIMEKKEAHIHLIRKGIQEIAKGTFKKVVLSRRLEVDANQSSLKLFQTLLIFCPDAFCYLWYHPKVGLWLGATPEILLKLRNRELTTMSLAGTQRYTGREKPQWGSKELDEQKLVTDFIIDILKDKAHHLKKNNTETVRAGNLLHLRTKISGLVEKENLETIVKALHPTPAVCGLPKASTRQFISANEDYDREYYTGFLGELNLKTEKQRSTHVKNQENLAYRSIATTTTLYVNLRCMQLKSDKAYIYVGGGITKDSDPEQEWEETVAKSRTMLSILG